MQESLVFLDKEEVNSLIPNTSIEYLLKVYSNDHWFSFSTYLIERSFKGRNSKWLTFKLSSPNSAPLAEEFQEVKQPLRTYYNSWYLYEKQRGIKLLLTDTKCRKQNLTALSVKDLIDLNEKIYSNIEVYGSFVMPRDFQNQSIEISPEIIKKVSKTYTLVYGKLSKIYGEDYKKLKVKLNNIVDSSTKWGGTISTNLVFNFSLHHNMDLHLNFSTYNKEWLLFDK